MKILSLNLGVIRVFKLVKENKVPLITVTLGEVEPLMLVNLRMESWKQGRRLYQNEIEVETALEKGKLGDILDVSAEDRLFMRAKQLVHFALRCCNVNSKNRLDLGSEILRVLEPMKVLCQTSTSFRLRSEENCRVPSYFIGPIFQETMQDPHIAVDGFTYEVEAIKGWIDGGHKSLPMINLELAHCNLNSKSLSPLCDSRMAATTLIPFFPFHNIR
ncbi:hypothetical protein GIB67_003217 [Kingdonia uniflora]|uniref:RING-type E3 ubiquitin transferase n=1 Tax=Kingdonia uniflora TaxID=39325 RepID=A0A7J7LGR4_9MAGN|nr:hypothetical protein GIB67_003217 [Kingdonia uniflora]